MNEKGNISINTENILPIIKKWLYSDKDIFLREVVSNAIDAITKHKKVASLGESAKPERYRVDVKVNKKDKTITVSDNGIGMTFEEVKQYINQIAFSGAIDFFEKYKDKTDAQDQIIGHFGLGFYSVFMVSDFVEIQTRSFVESEKPVYWKSDGASGYEMSEGSRQTHGTDVILHINSDKENKDLVNVWKMREILEKYCRFLPVEIYLSEDGAKKDDKQEEKPVNNTSPLWLKDAKECTDEQYKEFYKEVFHDFKEPLFWIHLKMDYPVNLRGILYFPKLTNEYNTLEGKIQLYCNQVYVADNIKEVIPEFLLLLKGVIDCPDLPLNVSRSFLQNDGYSGKIAGHISKKVSDKLKQLYKDDAEQYSKYWDDINIFVKYGCLKEEKFYDKVKDCIIYKDIYGKYHTLDQYKKAVEDKKQKDKIYYVTDMQKQAQYINMFKEHELNAVILDNILDSHFISFIESKNQGTSFMGIDSGIKDVLGEDSKTEGFDDVKKFFEDLLKEKNVAVEIQSLKASDVSAVITANEYENRMKSMQTMYGMDLPSTNTLVLNIQNPVVKKLAAIEDEQKKKDVAIYVYQLAMLAAGKLEKEDMTDFLRRNNEMLNKTAD
ncbi:MAG TPA: molecular chaperone HtpG [Clostridia bacterium]|nr:molecular chaperone HtpG [Clostridia bacterium]